MNAARVNEMVALVAMVSTYLENKKALSCCCPAVTALYSLELINRACFGNLKEAMAFTHERLVWSI